MATQNKNYASTPRYRWNAETLGTTKGGMRRIKRLIEASGQIGLTVTRIARFVNCTVHDATVLMDNLASVGAIKQRNNATRTYAINPHYTGTVWYSLLS